MAEYHYILTLSGGSATRPWTRTWVNVLNLEPGASRQVVYDGIYRSLAKSREHRDLFTAGETVVLFFSLEPDRLS